MKHEAAIRVLTDRIDWERSSNRDRWESPEDKIAEAIRKIEENQRYIEEMRKQIEEREKLIADLTMTIDTLRAIG